MNTKFVSLGLIAAILLLAVLPVRGQLTISRDAGDVPFENVGYLDFHVGWGTPHNVDVQTVEFNSTDELYGMKNVYGSLGSGLRFGLETGYYFHKGFSGSLAFDGVIGNTIKAEHTESYMSYYSSTLTEEFKANHLLISVKGNYTWNLQDNRFTISAGAGPCIAIWGMKKYLSNYTSEGMEDYKNETIYEEHYKMKPGVGITGHVSVLYDVSDQLSVGPTISLNSIALKFNTSEVVDYLDKYWDPYTGTVHTSDLNDWDLEDIHYEYVDEITDEMEGDGFTYWMNESNSFAHIEWGIRIQYKFNRDPN